MQTAHDSIKQALEAYKQQEQELWKKVTDVASNYEKQIVAAINLTSDVCCEVREKMDEESGEWLDSPRGQQFEDWVGTWEGALFSLEDYLSVQDDLLQDAKYDAFTESELQTWKNLPTKP